MKATHLYHQIISIENLFQAWNEFRVGKRNRLDVQSFEINVEDNLFELHQQLKIKTYKHSSYTAFNIYDPKFRHIHKAKVLDRIVHHAIVSVIEPIFDKTFIYDSYSCRKDKGMHRAVLLECIRKRIEDKDLLWLIENILKSFSKNTGIPIGNLTSQIFANIYLNEFDKFIKQELRIKYYIRYSDDFVILSRSRGYLEELISQIGVFLKINLKLSLHEDKIIFRKYNQGIDFLGYIVLPHYVLPRTKTIKRMFRKLEEKRHLDNFNQTLESYLGYLSHAHAFKLQREILRRFAPQDDSWRISPKFS